MWSIYCMGADICFNSAHLFKPVFLCAKHSRWFHQLSARLWSVVPRKIGVFSCILHICVTVCFPDGESLVGTDQIRVYRIILIFKMKHSPHSFRSFLALWIDRCMMNESAWAEYFERIFGELGEMSGVILETSQFPLVSESNPSNAIALRSDVGKHAGEINTEPPNLADGTYRSRQCMFGQITFDSNLFSVKGANIHCSFGRYQYQRTRALCQHCGEGNPR